MRLTPERPAHRWALLAGLVGLGAVLVVNVPALADPRAYRSPAMVLSHVAMGLIALGLSPRFPGWVEWAAALSPRRRGLALAVALVGPPIVMAAGLAMAPEYGHRLFTREWGIVEPLQFVLWLTAAWLAFERARCDEPRTADDRVFRLAGWACLVLAMEEIDYLGIVSALARAAGAPKGRIGGQHFGGFHDVLNAVAGTSLVLGLVALGVGAAIVLAWCASRGLLAVVWREALSPTSLPLAGAFAFLAIAQLSDFSYPPLRAVVDSFAVVRDLSEEPAELLALVCVNASLLAKLTARRHKSEVRR